jgi:hypothetical protein
MSTGRRVALTALAAVAAALPAHGAHAHAGAPGWSVPWLLARVDGGRVSVGSWSGRVQSSSTLCSGEGLGRRWAGMRHWRHFTCTWTVIGRRGAARDVTFRVHALTMRRYRITDSRFGPY